MNARIEFILPEEQEEFMLTLNAKNMASALSNMKSNLRNILKYQDLSDETYNIIEKIQLDLLNDLIDLNINDII